MMFIKLLERLLEMERAEDIDIVQHSKNGIEDVFQRDIISVSEYIMLKKLADKLRRIK